MIVGLLAGLSILVATRRRVRRLRSQLNQALHQAHHDQLTGLPNREAALTHLDSAPVALVGMLDLDDFKAVNDRYGHHVGDLLLKAVAERLRTAMAGNGMVARLAGDEFLLAWSPPPAQRIRHAASLLQRISGPLTIDGHRVVPAASLGLAQPGPHLDRPATLIAAADEAMYNAKRHRQDGQPHLRLYRDTYPPAPADREITGRRSPRDRPPAGTSVPVQEGRAR